MKFKPLTPSDYTSLKPLFAGQRYELCPYSLSSIIAWTNEVYQPYGAVQGDSLVIYANFTTHKERSHLILPISPDREHTPEELVEISRQTGYGTYWFVPEDYVNRHVANGLEDSFVIERQEEYDDYVYRTEDLAILAGGRYSKKRNLIKQFERNYPEKEGGCQYKDHIPGRGARMPGVSG